MTPELVGGFNQLNAITHGDIADGPPFGREDERYPVQRSLGGDMADDPGPASGMQVGEAAGVAYPGELRRQTCKGPGGQQPRNARTDHVAADQQHQPGAEYVIDGCAIWRDPSCPFQPFCGDGSPVGVSPAACVEAAGVPTLLPGLPGLGIQPV